MSFHSPSSRSTYGVGDVVDHNGSLGSPVVHGCQAVIPFLSSSVPDLKLDRCVIQTYCLCEERSWEGKDVYQIKRTSEKWSDILIGIIETTMKKLQLKYPNIFIWCCINLFHRFTWCYLSRKYTNYYIKFTARTYDNKSISWLTEPAVTWQRKERSDLQTLTLKLCNLWPACSWWG